MKSGLLRFCLALVGIIVFVTVAIELENQLGIPFAITFRIACASACLFLIAKIATDYPGERWPWIAFAFAMLFDIGLFFSPLSHLPASKGDLLFFGLPDATILLTARTLSYRVTDVHERAVRQQLIMGLILALSFSIMVLSITFIPQYLKY